jgi:hypothetical protein
MRILLENIKRHKYRILLSTIFLMIGIFSILYFFSQTLIRHNAKAALDGIDIKLVPTSITVKKDEEFSVSVIVDTKEKIITASELHLSYDDKILQGISVKVGTMLPVILKDGEFKNGDVSFIIGCTPTERKKGSGLIATLTFKALNSTNTRLDFTQNTRIAALGEANNVVGNMTGSEIKQEELPTTFISPTVSPTILPSTIPTESVSLTSTPETQPTIAHTILPTLSPSKQPQITPSIITPTPSETVATKILQSILSFPSRFIQNPSPTQPLPTALPTISPEVQPSPISSPSVTGEKPSFVLDVQKQIVASSSGDDFAVPTAPLMTPTPQKKVPITGIQFIDDFLHFFGL